jgi:hypothetical protein
MRIDSCERMAKGFGLMLAGCLCLLGVRPIRASNCKSSTFYVPGAFEKAPQVTVAGKATREFRWGPPNFGEHPKTDSHWYPWFLQLDYPIRIRFQDANQPQTVLRNIQVRGKFELNGSYEQFRGRHIEVRGKLYEATAPSDETNAVLEATDVTFAKRPRCPG